MALCLGSPPPHSQALEMISMALRKLPLPAKKKKKNKLRNGGVPRSAFFHFLVLRHFLLIFLLFLSFGAANIYIFVTIVRQVWNFCRSRELADHQQQLRMGTCTTQLTKHPFHFLNHTQRIIPHTRTHKHTRQLLLE